jgi:hypothetical protein
MQRDSRAPPGDPGQIFDIDRGNDPMLFKQADDDRQLRRPPARHASDFVPL